MKNKLKQLIDNEMNKVLCDLEIKIYQANLDRDWETYHDPPLAVVVPI